MKYPENLHIDTIYEDIKPYIQPKQNPYFTGDFDTNLLQYNTIDNMPYMVINQKSAKAFYIMPCNESGKLTNIYAVVNKRFTTLEKAKDFFNKYIRNVVLIDRITNE